MYREKNDWSMSTIIPNDITFNMVYVYGVSAWDFWDKSDQLRDEKKWELVKPRNQITYFNYWKIDLGLAIFAFGLLIVLLRGALNCRGRVMWCCDTLKRAVQHNLYLPLDKITFFNKMCKNKKKNKLQQGSSRDVELRRPHFINCNIV